MLAGPSSALFFLLAAFSSSTATLASYVLPLEFVPGTHSSGTRRLRHSSDLNLTGGIDVGYFYTRIQLGTPPQSFSVIADTGSSLTYVPCDTCEHCGTGHDDSPFETLLSSTYEQVGCQDEQCGLVCRSHCCKDAATCKYRRAYTEGSSVSGNLVQDSLWLKPPSSTDAADSVDGGQSTPHQRTALSSGRKLQQSTDGHPTGHVEPQSTQGVAAPILFGCVTDERGQIYRQKADGILGLADEDLSIPNQLATAGATSDTFTLCYGTNSGVLILGDVHPDVFTALPPPITTARSRVAPFYNVHLSGISLGEEQLDIDYAPFEQSYGTILDSGTTFTYLPTEAHKAFSSAFVKAVEATGRKVMMEESVGTYCFVASDLENHQDLAGSLPGLTLLLGAHQKELKLRPKSYLFKQPFLNGSQSAWCLGMLDGGATAATIGAITLRDVAVTMDKKRREIHFRPVPSCLEFAGAVAAVGPESNTVGSTVAAGSAATGVHSAAQSPPTGGDAPKSGEQVPVRTNNPAHSSASPGAETQADSKEAVRDDGTASDAATEGPIATGAAPVEHSAPDKQGVKLQQDPLDRQQRLYVALGGMGGILALVLAAIAYWWFCGGGRNGSQGTWDYKELVDNKKLLEGYRNGRQSSEGSRVCELAAWHNDDFDDWMMDSGGYGVSPFTLGEPGSSAQGSWTEREGTREAHTLISRESASDGLSTVYVRHDGSRQLQDK